MCGESGILIKRKVRIGNSHTPTRSHTHTHTHTHSHTHAHTHTHTHTHIRRTPLLTRLWTQIHSEFCGAESSPWDKRGEVEMAAPPGLSQSSLTGQRLWEVLPSLFDATFQLDTGSGRGRGGSGLVQRTMARGTMGTMSIREQFIFRDFNFRSVGSDSPILVASEPAPPAQIA